MPQNPLDKLLKPRFPSSAVGIKTGTASVVQLERSRGAFVIKRAATLNLPANVIRSSFDDSNILDPNGLAAALMDLATSAGLLRQKKWSVTLPEAAARTTIVTMETAGGSRREIEEVLEWKIERAFGAPLDELRVGREELPASEQKQARYLITAVRSAILAEYESVFASMGWHTGLMLPRHVGEWGSRRRAAFERPRRRIHRSAFAKQSAVHLAHRFLRYPGMR
jgi:Tfp pilus assembly PilM family ATPase